MTANAGASYGSMRPSGLLRMKGERLEGWFYVLALTTGLHVSDLLGVRWSDIDLSFSATARPLRSPACQW
jgi:integrase